MNIMLHCYMVIDQQCIKLLNIAITGSDEDDGWVGSVMYSNQTYQSVVIFFFSCQNVLFYDPFGVVHYAKSLITYTCMNVVSKSYWQLLVLFFRAWKDGTIQMIIIAHNILKLYQINNQIILTFIRKWNVVVATKDIQNKKIV